MAEPAGDATCSRTVSILGTRVMRVEDPKFLTTGGTYADDLRDSRLDGAGHVTYVRSVMAHARITVDATGAVGAPGVLGVFTIDDFRDLAPMPLPLPMLPPAMNRTYLADGVTRYVGEPVAIVVTDTKYAGEDAAELVSVAYDPLPVVVDPKDATKDEVVLFPEVGNNTVLALENGDPDTVLDGCDVVVRAEIRNQRLAPVPLEVRGSACAWENADGSGRLTFWASTQNPHDARNIIAEAMQLQPDDVHFIAPDVGGGFGAKFGVSVEDVLLAAVSRRLGRPMRWTESRAENMLSMGHGRAQHQTIGIGGSRDGNVTAYSLDVLQ